MAHEVALLGAGVMGGSLARALSVRGRTVRVWTPDFSDAAAAGSLPGVTVAPDAAGAVEGVDGVVIATPLSAVGELLPRIVEAAPGGAWLQDVASLQAPPLAVAARLDVLDRYVSAHPMAGSHRSGFEGSSDDLYDGAPVWLSDRGADPGIRAAVLRFWQTLGAAPDWVDGKVHDARMIRVSHLPQMVAVAVARAIAAEGCSMEDLGPGGRQVTRLAASNPRMWRDLFEHSGPELARILRDLASALESDAEALGAGDLDRIVAAFESAGEWRGE